LYTLNIVTSTVASFLCSCIAVCSAATVLLKTVLLKCLHSGFKFKTPKLMLKQLDSPHR